MIIQLSKFGTTLTSRPNGKEAYDAFLPGLRDINQEEKLVIDFDGVNTFTPAWADEFLSPLYKEFSGRLFIKKSPNLSVQATLKILEEIHGIDFNIT
ncbi:MAG: DUF4325 domain-containing protein [bacterium]